jgi:RimJ/RimL family protein N-acetyltransferase
MVYVLNHLDQPVGLPVPGWTPPAWPSREPLVGTFCRVEPLDVERHARDLYEANALDRQGRLWTYLSYGPFDTLESYTEWLHSAARSDDPLFYAIVESRAHTQSGLALHLRPLGTAPQQASGVAAYLRIKPANGSIEVGHINFSPRLQRTPAATEAMYLMMKYAFELGYRRYEWKCDALNAKSRAAAQRLGLSFEGIFRQALVYKGRNRDTAWYAAIDQEWPALESAFLRWLDPSNFTEEGQQRSSLSDLTAPLLTPPASPRRRG